MKLCLCLIFLEEKQNKTIKSWFRKTDPKDIVWRMKSSLNLPLVLITIIACPAFHFRIEQKLNAGHVFRTTDGQVNASQSLRAFRKRRQPSMSRVFEIVELLESENSARKERSDSKTVAAVWSLSGHFRRSDVTSRQHSFTEHDSNNNNNNKRDYNSC